MVHTISGIQIYQSDNVWNRKIDNLPIHSSSDSWKSAIGTSQPAIVHVSTPARFPSFGGWGIPVNLVTNSTPTYNLVFSPFASVSDNGIPYPIPNGALVEEQGLSGSDQHMVCLNTDTGFLYELYQATFNGTTWSAQAGGRWNLQAYTMHANGFGGSTASGFPCLVGLVMYDEVLTGVITHALRLSIPWGSNTFIWPATHADGINGNGAPPHGSRCRLRSSFNASGLSTNNQIIVQSLKDYGCYVSDQSGGNSFGVFGCPDSRWSDADINTLNTLMTVADFEFVDASVLKVSSTSWQSRPFVTTLFPSTKRRGQLESVYDATIMTDTPSAYYRLNDTGTTAQDSSGNIRQGTLAGAVTTGQTGPLAYSTDTCMRFDGTTGSILLPSSVNTYFTGHFTFECWLKLNSLPHTPRILSNDLPSTTNNGMELFINFANNTVNFQVGNGTTTRAAVSSAISINTWYHLAVTWDGANIQIYINGVASGAAVTLSAIGAPLHVPNIARPASYSNNDFFNGWLDEIAIYNTNLTPTQILNHYTSGTTGKNVIIFPSTKRRQP